MHKKFKKSVSESKTNSVKIEKRLENLKEPQDTPGIEKEGILQKWHCRRGGDG